jgi:hypothetical protein
MIFSLPCSSSHQSTTQQQTTNASTSMLRYVSRQLGSASWRLVSSVASINRVAVVNASTQRNHKKSTTRSTSRSSTTTNNNNNNTNKRTTARASNAKDTRQPNHLVSLIEQTDLPSFDALASVEHADSAAETRNKSSKPHADWVQRKWRVVQDDGNMRLDHFIRRQCPELPLSVIFRLVRSKNLQVKRVADQQVHNNHHNHHNHQNDTAHVATGDSCADTPPSPILPTTLQSPRTRGQYRLEVGDEVSLTRDLASHNSTLGQADADSTSTAATARKPIKNVSASSPKVRQLRQNIVYQDEHLMIVNKPAGLAVQGKDVDIVSMLQVLSDNPNVPLRLVHRLDKACFRYKPMDSLRSGTGLPQPGARCVCLDRIRVVCWCWPRLAKQLHTWANYCDPKLISKSSISPSLLVYHYPSMRLHPMRSRMQPIACHLLMRYGALQKGPH